VIARVAQAQLLPVSTLPSTSRGSGGWGSTGRS
jgi:dUTPase